MLFGVGSRPRRKANFLRRQDPLEINLEKKLDAAETSIKRLTKERTHLAERLEDAEKTVDQLRDIIDEHKLPISKAVGGRKKRTKKHLKTDVIAALRRPLDIRDMDYYANVVNALPEDRHFKDEIHHVRLELDRCVDLLSEWVDVEQAKKILYNEVRLLYNDDPRRRV